MGGPANQDQTKDQRPQIPVCVIGCTFRTPVESALTGKAAASFRLDMAQPNVLVGVIIGMSVVFLLGIHAIEAGGANAVTAPLGLLLTDGAWQ